MSEDIELRFFGALLRASPGEQQEFYTRQIPRSVFRVRTAQVHWIYTHREKFQQYPSIAAFESKFNDKIPEVSESVSAALNPILEFAMFLQMRKVHELVKESLDKGTPILDAMTLFKAEAAKLSAYSTDYTDLAFHTSMVSDIRYRERVRARRLGTTMLSPWPALNGMVKSFQFGEVVILSARPNLGKTWGLVAWANFLSDCGFPVLFITKEMPTEQIADRLEAHRFGLDYSAFREGTLPASELRRWRDDRTRFISKAPLTLCGHETVAGVGLEHVVSKIEEYVPAVVVVDGAYLIYPEGCRKNATEVERLTFLSNRLKSIAKAKKLFLIATVQLNRSAETQSGQTKGALKAVFGADAWSQDCDYLLSLDGDRHSPLRNIDLLKGRESSLGGFPINFQLSPRPNFTQLGAMPVAPVPTSEE